MKLNISYILSVRVTYKINKIKFCLKVLVLLGAFVKFQKVTISFVMSVRLSVRMEQLRSHWTDFHENLYFNTFRKYVEKIKVYLEPHKNNGYFT
jgi:hypothetical protein